MSRSTLSGAGWSIEIHQEWIDITGIGPQPDPSWRYTDHADHEHHATQTGGHPTLVEVVDKAFDCDGITPRDECYRGWDWVWNGEDEVEVWGDHEPHTIVLKSHLACPLCGESIVPGELAPGTRLAIPGLKSMTVTAALSTGHKRTCYLDSETAERFEAAGRDDLGPMVIAYVTDCDPQMVASEEFASR